MAVENIKYSDFKNHVLNEFEKHLATAGFALVKSQLAFKKAIPSGKIVVGIDFLDYSPIQYEFHFTIIIWIKEIEKITTIFFRLLEIDEPVKWTAFFPEADFLNDKGTLDPKFRINFYHEVKSSQEIDNTVAEALSTLINKALPKANQIATLDAFREYYINHKCEIVNNFHSNELFVSILLAAYLKSPSEFHFLAEYLKKSLDELSTEGKHYTQLYYYLQKLNEFVYLGQMKNHFR